MLNEGAINTPSLIDLQFLGGGDKDLRRRMRRFWSFLDRKKKSRGSNLTEKKAVREGS